jgi:hypothetical protein
VDFAAIGDNQAYTFTAVNTAGSNEFYGKSKAQWMK